MMKKKSIKLLVLGIALVAITISCDDQAFLEENPTAFTDPESLISDEAGAEIFLIGVYDAVQQVVGSSDWHPHWGVMATDEVLVPGWENDKKLINQHQVFATNGTVSEIWEKLYIGVNKANSVVDRIGALDESVLSAASKNSMVAQARYLRAMLYFSLVSSWENVPLKTNETNSLNNVEAPPAPPEAVYNFIIEDLQYAASVLEVEQGGGKATKGAAQALLGKVYLQMTGFPLNQTDKLALAKEQFEDVMNSGVYDLLEDYPSVFDLDNEQSVEMVFAIGMEGPGLDEGGNYSTFFGPSGDVNNGGGWGQAFINPESILKYENAPGTILTLEDVNDIRYLNNVAKHDANNWTPEEGMVNPASWEEVDSGWRWRGWKWHASKPNNYANDTPFDDPYIRYADVLLMYAEVKNSLGELTQADLDMTVNRLRARARLTPTAVPDMVLGSQDENSAALLDERFRELFLEGWRRNDLIRFGVYEETILAIDLDGSFWTSAGNPGPNYEPHEIRWPIPDNEMQLNSLMVQNPGY